MSNRVIRGAGGFKIGVPLDVLLTFTEIGDFRGHLKEVKGGPGGHQESNVALRGANKLPWPRGFQFGATLDALLEFLKLGDFRGHLKEVKGGQGDTRSQMWT